MQSYRANYCIYQYNKYRKLKKNEISDSSNQLNVDLILTNHNMEIETTLYGTGEIPYKQKKSKKCWKAFLLTFKKS